MSYKNLVIVCILLILVFTVSSCGQTAETTLAPSDIPPTATIKPLEATMTLPANSEVTTSDILLICSLYQTGALDDPNFGAATWKAVQTAAETLGGIEVAYLETEPEGFNNSIGELINGGCDLIIGVGNISSNAIKAAAEANPEQKFAQLDANSDLALPNVATSVFAIDQANFLLGYLAASQTKTGKIGTYAGMIYPELYIFMDSFYMGMMKYNQAHEKNVELLGWDPATGEGYAVGNFGDRDKGEKITMGLIAEGADIILPVAGAAGLGSLDASQWRDALLVSMDGDWSVMYPEYSNKVLASGTKNVDMWFFETIESVKNGTFVGNAYTGSLQNGGIGIALGIDFINSLDPVVITEIDQLLEEIKTGSVDINYNR